MKPERIQTGIRFSPELLYKITFVAKKNHRSLNAQLEHLAQLSQKPAEGTGPGAARSGPHPGPGRPGRRRERPFPGDSGAGARPARTARPRPRPGPAEQR